MKQEIYHSNNINLAGSGVFRTAVRAVVFNGSKILMIHSAINGDYKFPGGGLEGDENHRDALFREVSEECGLKLKSIDALAGKIIEYDKALEASKDYFRMESFYYRCSISNDKPGIQNLDEYEEELQFIPKWVSLSEAVCQNEKIMKSGKWFPRWTKRETIFLKYIADVESIPL